MQRCVITVGQKCGDYIGSTNTAVQAGVDRAASLGGGEVRVLPGRYEMRDSLHLRPNVSVVGAGGETVLWKPPSASSPVAGYYLGYGHFDVSVAEPGKFAIGDGICITDDQAGGFYSTVATITWKDGAELGLSRFLNADIDPHANGHASTVYPVVSGCGVENASVQGLSIEGNASENDWLNGCRGGGIFLLQCRDIRLDGITIQGFNGDGISFQQCTGTSIYGCRCIGNRGHGLHPGSGSAGAEILNTTCSANGGDGIFFCLRASHILVEGCVLDRNADHGVSIGHRDTDELLRNNRISYNGKSGAFFRPDGYKQSGHRTVFEGNCFESNGMLEPNGEILFESSTDDVRIIGNRFMGKQGRDAEPAIIIRQPQTRLLIADNVNEASSVPVVVEGELAGVCFKKPDHVVVDNDLPHPARRPLHLG